jgi:hypothetical protein
MNNGNSGKNGNNGKNSSQRESSALSSNTNNVKTLFKNVKTLQNKIEGGEEVLYIISNYPSATNLGQDKIIAISIDEKNNLIHIKTAKSGTFHIAKEIFPNLKINGNNIIKYIYKNKNEYNKIKEGSETNTKTNTKRIYGNTHSPTGLGLSNYRDKYYEQLRRIEQQQIDNGKGLPFERETDLYV